MAVLELSEVNFKDETSSGICVLDIHAKWCGPCKQMSPIIDQIAEEMVGLKFCKLDADTSGEICQQFGVMSIPTLILFREGKVIATRTGAIKKEALKEWVEFHLKLKQ